jgi:hypothetical protein
MNINRPVLTTKNDICLETIKIPLIIQKSKGKFASNINIWWKCIDGMPNIMILLERQNVHSKNAYIFIF